jgi:hypothetical protein
MARKIVRSQEITRTADTTAYTAGDLVGAASAPVTFKFTGLKPGKIINILSARLYDSADVATKLAADLVLFRGDITIAVADNAAFTLSDADSQKVCAIVPFATTDGHGIDTTSGAGGNSVSQVSSLNVLADTDQNGKLYGVLLARNAYVPVSDEKFMLELTYEDD